MKREQAELVLAQLLFAVSSTIAGFSCFLALCAVLAPMYEGATIWDALGEMWPWVVQPIPFIMAAVWQGVRLRAWAGRLKAMPALERWTAIGRTLALLMGFGCITYLLTVLGNSDHTVAASLVPIGAAALSFQVAVFLSLAAGVVRRALHRRPSRGQTGQNGS
jgi:hypothetical protein